MANEYEAVVTFGLTLLGSGVGTSLVVAWFKKQFDTELEQQKAILQRGSRVHEKQIDALLEIYWRLERAHYFLQRLASPFMLTSETKEGLAESMMNELSLASLEYAKKKLLVPSLLSAKLDQFFGLFLSARVDLSERAVALTPAGTERAQLWKAAQITAYENLPGLLAAIELEARQTIHSQ